MSILFHGPYALDRLNFMLKGLHTSRCLYDKTPKDKKNESKEDEIVDENTPDEMHDRDVDELPFYNLDYNTETLNPFHKKRRNYFPDFTSDLLEVKEPFEVLREVRTMARDMLQVMFRSKAHFNSPNPKSYYIDPVVDETLDMHAYPYFTKTLRQFVENIDIFTATALVPVGHKIKVNTGNMATMYHALSRLAERNSAHLVDVDFSIVQKIFQFLVDFRKNSMVIDNQGSLIEMDALVKGGEEISITLEELGYILDMRGDSNKYTIVMRNVNAPTQRASLGFKILLHSLNAKVFLVELDMNTTEEAPPQDVLSGLLGEEAMFKQPRAAPSMITLDMSPKRRTPHSPLCGLETAMGFLSTRLSNPDNKVLYDASQTDLTESITTLDNLRLISGVLYTRYLQLSLEDKNAGLSPDELTAYYTVLQEKILDIYEINNIVNFALRFQEMDVVQNLVPPPTDGIRLRYLVKAFNHIYPKPTSGIPSEGPKKSIIDNLTPTEQKIYKNFVEPSMIDTIFDDIGSLTQAKEELLSLLLPIHIKAFKQNNELIRSPIGILLYGPPGTGKTMLVRALAKTANVSFLHISTNTILSKWLGESEENTAAIFSLAKKLSPSIIFVDEVDGLLKSRSGGDHESTRRVKNEFFSCWDGMTSENDLVTVICATNRPFDLDAAALRRLPHRVHVPLPDLEARKEIFEKYLKDVTICKEMDPKHPKDKESISAEERQEIIDILAEKTHNYSGSDIKSICVRAASQILRDFMVRYDYNYLLTHMDQLSLDEEATQYASKPVTLKEFEIALNEIASSVDPKAGSQLQLTKWHETYGHKEEKSLMPTFGF